GRCRCRRACPARPRRRDAGAARGPDVGRSGALGAHPAGLRAVRSQRLGNRPPPQNAPPHPAAYLVEARAAELSLRTGRGFWTWCSKRRSAVPIPGGSSAAREPKESENAVAATSDARPCRRLIAPDLRLALR